MKNKLMNYFLLTLLGIAIFLIGVLLLKNNVEKYVSGICMGIGTAIFIIFSRKAEVLLIEEKYHDINKQLEMEINDERNTLIRDKAGAKTNRMMNYLLFILTITFTFMNVNLFIILSMVALIIIQAILFIMFSNRYNKKM